jgi:hypothetical protein
MGRPGDPVTSDDEPARGDIDADDHWDDEEDPDDDWDDETPYPDDVDPDTDWELMQDEGSFPAWI